MLGAIKNKALNNELLTENEANELVSVPLEELLQAANEIRSSLCGNSVSLCSIINGKSGRCSENCKFCAQSGCHNTNINEYLFVEESKLVEDCKYHERAGVRRYSIVTAGRTLSDEDCDKAASAYASMKKVCPQMKLCGSHGLLTYEQLLKLKESGIDRYHCNIESSERYFPNICTTHTFADKLKTIEAAKRAGLDICSGGIIGMGESMADRISMAFTLRKIGAKSIPINALTPIKNTPFEKYKPLSEDEILRTCAIFRFVNPTAQIRIAAGRALMKNKGRAAFTGGVNAAITGDLLTTTGSTIAEDMSMLSEIGMQII